ncbi:alpha/beta fold hydrolase [Glaciecola sp. SC05]|uniref:alpha/beta fold hydrolase n=1 Tax=Glaciecola sp. SC05 TaxID=1987355 RepID=UPI0035286478
MTTKQLCLLALLSFTLFTQAQVMPEKNATQSSMASSYINDYVSEVTNVVCPFKNDIDYEQGRVRCGFITVPENREVSDSRFIRLAFTQIVAQANPANIASDKDVASQTEDDAPVFREDPIMYLTGGPGAGMEYYVARFLEHELSKTRDIYILNQRGIGDSEELCPYYMATSRELIVGQTLAEQEQQDAQRMRDCFEAAANRGIDLSAYNTVENARDVRALRQALGFDSWNVWGISYGSHLGQMLVNIDPQGIRALVLDAIVPNDLVDLQRIHRYIARNHAHIFEECARQNASICDGLEDAFYAAGNALINDPILVDAMDKELFPAGKANVSPLLVAGVPFSMLYEQDSYPAIPAVMRSLVEMIETRDAEVFQVFVSDSDLFAGISQGMYNAITCNDGYAAEQARTAAEDLQESYGFTQGLFSVEGAQLMADTCVAAGLSPRSREHYQLIESDIPTLIVNGDWDPITPNVLAQRIAPGFSNGRLIIVPYAGHGPTRSMSECATQVLTDFFDDPIQELENLDASCLEKGAEPPEFLDYVQTHMPLKFAARAIDNPKRLFVPALLASTPILFSLIGFIMIAWGTIARRFSSSAAPVPGIGPITPRLTTLISALVLLMGVSLVGAGLGATFEISEISILAGFAPPAGIGALLVMFAGLLGIASILITLKSHRQNALRKRTLIGLNLMGLSAVLLSVTFIVWGITPW